MGCLKHYNLSISMLEIDFEGCSIHTIADYLKMLFPLECIALVLKPLSITVTKILKLDEKRIISNKDNILWEGFYW